MLVSEVMLQQTQATRVIGAYARFLDRFPDVESLAAAPLADVLRAWGDLGYNRRAVRLHAAARAVVAGGRFPDDLTSLPGVGVYTARAVASFAFGADVAVLETNVRRIVTRFTGDDRDAAPEAGRWLPPGRSAAWNQALMDLGETVCMPRNPRCTECPLRARCARLIEPVRRRRAPRFETTTRYARGGVVRVLREAAGPLSSASIVHRTGLEPGRVDAALIVLGEEGIVSRTAGGRVRLGGQRARARSSVTSETR